MTTSTKKCKRCDSQKTFDLFYQIKNVYMNNCIECVDKIRDTTTELYCSGCDETLSVSNFRYRNDRKHFEKTCSDCAKKRQKKHREANIERIKERDKNYHLEHKEERNARDKVYYKTNIDSIKERKQKFYQDNKEKILEAQRARYNNDIKFRLNSSLRRRVRANMRSGKECNDLLECSIEHLKEWFQFYMDLENEENKTEYSFDNYGKYWHIDHVIPCALFDPTIDIHKQLCYHWSNLSPLICNKNQSKSDSLDEKIINKQRLRLKLFIKGKEQTLTIFDRIVNGALDTAGLLKNKSQQLEEMSSRW